MSILVDAQPHVIVGLCIIVAALLFWVGLRLMDPK